MQNWAEIRRRVLVDGQSKRSICREFDIHWDTLQKILLHNEPPGYRQNLPRSRPKLEPFLPIIHQILQDDRKRRGSSGIPFVASFNALEMNMAILVD
ncbi:hypothetical protein V5E97_24930 [Singulisphaera sp. Ch08]|uniref:Transposase n=1 Tax=Singulisphaera sp. Ch08 TaxID=3120278 RepID=A0AAU7C863_9BACT